MALPATDNFNRGSLGPKWSLNTGSLNIYNSVQVQSASSGAETGMGWNADSFNADQYAFLTLANNPVGGGAIGPAARVAVDGTTDSYYCWYADAGGTYLQKMVAGTLTQIGTTLAGTVSGDLLRLEVSGTGAGFSLIGYRNGVNQRSTTGSTHAQHSSGRAGVAGWGSASPCTLGDTWEGGNLGGATTYPVSLGGAITRSGSLVRSESKGLPGSISRSGGILKITGRSIAASLTPAGVTVKSLPRGYSGNIFPTGLFVLQAQKPLGGTIAPGGALARSMELTKTATLGPVGSVIQLIGRVFAGAASSAGSLANVKTKLVSFSGSLPIYGLLNKIVSSLKTAAIERAGSLIEQMNRVFVGAASSSGALINIKTNLVSFAGSLTPAGVLAKEILKSLAGSLTPTGAIAFMQSLLRSLSGSINLAGALAKQVGRAFAATLTPSGIVNAVKLAGTYFLSLAGSLNPTGAIQRSVARTYSGQILSTGLFIKSLARTFAATALLAGSVLTVKLFILVFSGAIAAAGALERAVSKTILGTATATGALAKHLPRSFAGVLSFSGLVDAIKTITSGPPRLHSILRIGRSDRTLRIRREDRDLDIRP